jgi:Alr-MurF fusion protein
VPGEKIAARMAELSSIAMRLELKNGINHCSVINDSYSADLNSLTIALDFLVAQQQHKRRTVILSDFLESGREEDELYVTIAKALALTKIDRLIGIGARIGAHAAAIAAKFSGEMVFLPTVEAFRHNLGSLHFRDETILIKGARVFEFEEIDRLLTEQIHQTVMEVNLNAMAANLRAYRQLLQQGTLLMAMVKAYGYGSGSFEIANLLQFHGVDYLGVAYADEGVVLRKAGIRVPIMIMNTENSSFDSLVEYNLQPVIYSSSLLHSFDRWLKKEGIPAFPVHLELETGMNRLGFPPEDIDDLLKTLPAAAFKVVSVFSHFAASEEQQQNAFTIRQGQLYRETADRIRQTLGYPFLRHLANSAGIIRHPELQLDMVRLGIGLYGIDSANSQRLDLQEVSTLKTTIAQIKHLHEGDTIGYNRKGIAVNGMVIATVRIGYADGYARALGNGVGKMWINGRLAPTIGIISMDMTMIDITGIPDAKEGDEVVVFGKELSVSQLAAWAQTIPYEILTGVSQRVRRIYFED